MPLFLLGGVGIGTVELGVAFTLTSHVMSLTSLFSPPFSGLVVVVCGAVAVVGGQHGGITEYRGMLRVLKRPGESRSERYKD